MSLRTCTFVVTIIRVVIVCQNLQLPMQSVPITTNVASSNPAHGEVYSIQHYVIRFFSDLRQVGGISPGTPVSSTNKTDRNDIAEILLKVALNNISLIANLQWLSRPFLIHDVTPDLTGRVQLAEQELPSFPEHLSLHQVYYWWVRVARSVVVCVLVVFCRSLFVLLSFFLSVIVLPVLLRVMTSDYPFGIFKLFLKYKGTGLLLLFYISQSQ